MSDNNESIRHGRGRGRGWVWKLANVMMEARLSGDDATVESTSNLQPQPGHEFRDRYENDNGEAAELISSPSTPSATVSESSDSGNESSGHGSAVSIPEDAPPLQEQEAELTLMKIISVNFEDKWVQVALIGSNVLDFVKCKVLIHESPLMLKWKSDNHLIVKNGNLIENALLSALEMLGEQSIIAGRVRNDEHGGLVLLSIDVFDFLTLKRYFLTSLTFMMVPILPMMGRFKIGVITNLREAAGEVDVIIYDSIWVSLREAIHSLQRERNLDKPLDAISENIYRELIQGFKIHHFLAPLNNDWSELHRVKIIGIEDNDVVKVMYLDIGKQLSIPIKNLAIPTPVNYMPELIDMMPPQAVTLQVDKLDSNNAECLNSLRSALEGKVCYIKVVNDSEDLPLPVVDIYISHGNGSGIVSICDFVVASAGGDVPLHNNTYKLEPLTMIQKKLNDLVKAWEDERV